MLVEGIMVYYNFVLWQCLGGCSGIWTCDKILSRRNKLTIWYANTRTIRATLYGMSRCWFPKTPYTLEMLSLLPELPVSLSRQCLSQLPFSSKTCGLNDFFDISVTVRKEIHWLRGIVATQAAASPTVWDKNDHLSKNLKNGEDRK